jgi:hypothetical protein
MPPLFAQSQTWIEIGVDLLFRKAADEVSTFLKTFAIMALQGFSCWLQLSEPTLWLAHPEVLQHSDFLR